MSDFSAERVKFGPILLAPGFKRIHVLAFLVAFGCTSCLYRFVPMMQPFVLREILHVPSGEQGALTGQLVATEQLAMVVFLLVFGALADRFGRRVFMIAGAAGLTLAMLLYPLAGAIMAIFALRFMMGTVWAGRIASSAALTMDLPDNTGRGRFEVTKGLVQLGLTTLLVSYVGARLPAWLMDRGVPAADAGRYSFWLLAVVGVVAIAAAFGLKKDRPPAHERIGVLHTARVVWRSLRDVLAYAKVNPRYRLMLLLAPITRADTLIISTFLSLWIVNAAHDQGLDSAQAMRTLSTIAVTVGVVEILTSIAAGLLADRFDRLKMLIAGLAFTVVAFSTPLWVTDVTGVAIVVVVAFIQMVEGFTGTAITTLTAEVTPPELRGATGTGFQWIGMLSVMGISLLSGWLFDKAGYAAPFLVVSGMAAAWLLLALFMLRPRKER